MSDFEDDCTELRLYAENTRELYPDVLAAVKNLAKCATKPHLGKLSSCEKCLQPWVRLVVKAAAWYQAEIDPERMFSRDVKIVVATEWAADYLKRLEMGEEGLYD